MNRELKELTSLITNCCMSKNVSSRTAALKVLQLMTKDVDLSPIAGNITKLLACPDIFVKKVICSFIDKYAERVNGLNLLVTNTLIKDVKDANPLFRGVALKTLFRVPNLSEGGEDLLLTAIKDSNSYVRRVAVTSCCHYFKNCSHRNSELIDYLYEMIRDPHPGVVVDCLLALDEILSSEGGVVINYNMVNYLLSRMSSFDQWGVSTVLYFLRKYNPGKEEELFEILNSLDDYLTHHNWLIVVQTLEVFVWLCRTNFPHLANEAVDCVFPRLRSNLTSSNNELVYATLHLTEKFLDYHREIFSQNHRLLFCHFSDSEAVKMEKLSLLPRLTTPANISEVSDELISFCTDNSAGVYRAAIRSIRRTANLYPAHFGNLNRLISCLDLDQPPLTVQILNAFTRVNLAGRPETRSALLSAISKRYPRVKETQGKCAILQLLGDYGHTAAPTPYILESMWDRREEASVKTRLLTTAVKMFLRRPAEMQEILGFLLEKCADDRHCCVSQAAHFYYSVLHHIPLAKTVILGEEAGHGTGPESL